MRVHCADPPLRELATALGHTLVDAPFEADVVVLSGPAAWRTVRGWRGGGHRIPVVVFTDGPPVPDRPRLEPVVLLRRPEADALGAALEASGVGRPAGRIQLEGGTADLDLRRFEAHDGEVVRLTPLECRFLGYLAARSGRSCDRDELQLQVWDHRKPLATRAIDMLVARLRRKIEHAPRSPVSLLTAPGGYQLLVVEPVSKPPDSIDLVGRDALIPALVQTLDSHRALLLVGAPGVGKTAIARAIVETLASRERVLHLDASDVSSIPALAERLAQAVRIEVQPLPRLLRALSRNTLLWVDGLDAVGDAWARLADGHDGLLLGTARRVLQGSVVRTVPPLDRAAAEVLLRRRCERHGVFPSPDGARHLLAHADGLPRQIERLADQLPTTGSRAPLPSEPDAGLRAAWDRLDASCRSLVAAAATFHVPFDLAALRSVAPSIASSAWRTVVDTHLVLRRGDEGFVLLSGIRELALLEQSDAWEMALEGHARWVAQTCRPLLHALEGPRARAASHALRRLAADIEQAVGTAFESDTTTPAARSDLTDLVLSFDHVLQQRFERASRRQRIEDALAVVTDTVDRGRLLFAAASRDRHRNRARAEERYLEAADLLRNAAPWHGARAAVEAAKMGMATRPMPDLRARLRAWRDPVAAEDAMALVEGREQMFLDLMEEQTSEDVQHRLMVLADDLAELGRPFGATECGLAACKRMPLTGLGDPVAMAHRVVEWARQTTEPVLLGTALVELGTQLGAVGRTEASLDALSETESLFERAEPIRVWQARQARGIALAHAGRHDDARRVLDSYLDWTRRRQSLLGTADALLWLCGMECDAAQPRRVEVLAREGIDFAEQADNDNYARHGRYYLCWALAKQDRVPAATETLEKIDAHVVTSPLEQIRHGLLAHRLGRSPGDLEGLAAHIPGPTGAAVRTLLAAGPTELVQFRAGEPHHSLALRVLARFRPLPSAR